MNWDRFWDKDVLDCTPDVSGRRSSSPPPIRPDIHISAEGKFGEVLGVINYAADWGQVRMVCYC